MTGSPRRVAAITAGGLLVLAVAHFYCLRPGNFGGYDEWLILSLSSQSIIAFPQANRPYVLLWTLPAAVVPDSLWSYQVVHVLYLALTALCAAAIVRRLAPSVPTAAVMTGAFTLAWAPLDDVRLDSVLMAGYSGNTFATYAAILLLVEGWRRGSATLLVPAVGLAFVAARAGEVVLPLLAAAPAVLFLVPGPRRRGLAWWILAWEIPILAAAAIAAGPVLSPPPEGSYQASALGMDAHPGRWLGRTLDLVGLHLLPIGYFRASQMRLADMWVAAGVFAAMLAATFRYSPRSEGTERRECVRLLAVGIAASLLADCVLSLSPAIRSAARTQVLSSPAVGLVLASTLCLLASLATPARWLAGAAAVAIVAIGTGRTAAMQAEWDERSAFPAQSRSLAGLRSALPAVRPNTLIVLLDPDRTWPATFTFRHAVHHLYGPDVIGYVPISHAFLYPCRFLAAGVACEPWPVIREAWKSPPTSHRYDEIVVVRDRGAQGVEVLDAWPAVLPKPAEAAYSPVSRVTGGEGHACRIIGPANR